MKSKILLITLLLAGVFLNTYAQKNAGKLIPVLIIDGFSNHDWKQTSKLTKDLLEESGLFRVDISTMPAGRTDSAALAKWDPKFSDYKVVIQNTNNINTKIKWPAAVEKNLENYVKSGGGLYILHSGNNSFAHWEEYNLMIGLGWRSKDYGMAPEIIDGKVVNIPPGEGRGTSHGKRFNAGIIKLNDHPINKGYPQQWLTADVEVYTHPRGPAQNMTILSYALDSVSRKQWPMEWVVTYGKGKVYNSSMGHLWAGETYPVAYRCIGFQTTMIRAAEWLSTGKVTYKIPKNFPEKDRVSLREERDYPVRKQ